MPLCTALLRTWAPLLGLSLLAGCSNIKEVMDGERIDYKSSGSAKAPSLDIPPDLTQLSRDTRYVVPGTAVSANSYQVSQPTPSVATAASAVGDVRIGRAGSQKGSFNGCWLQGFR